MGRASIKVAIISSLVGKSPEEVAYSFVFDEAYKLAREGLDVHVIRSAIEEDSISYGIYFHGIEKRIDIQAFRLFLGNILNYPPLSLLRKPKYLYGENLYALNVIKVIERYNIDLIHAHFAYPEGWVGLLAKKAVRKPLIVTLHGCDILTEPSIGYGIRLFRRYDILIRRVLNQADVVIVASRAVYDEASKVIFNRKKIKLIPNGIDVVRFNPSNNGMSIRRKFGLDDERIIFTIRHHEPKYGIAYLIMAIPSIIKRFNNVTFIIGGEGSLKQYHEKLASRLGITKYVRFIGRVPRKELPLFYAASDVVVVPSIQEAFGLVVTEAMASGKPVVASRVGGIVDQVIDGYNGFLVPPRNPRAIAEKIIWLLEHPEEAKEMGMRGRKIVEEKFNIEKRITRIIKLYEKLLY